MNHKISHRLNTDNRSFSGENGMKIKNRDPFCLDGIHIPTDLLAERIVSLIPTPS